MLLTFTLGTHLFAEIPSSIGQNTISVGTGFPSIFNGGIQVFYPATKKFGIGGGLSTQLFLFNQSYIALQFHHSPQFSSSVFAEYGTEILANNVNHPTLAYGIGFSKKLPDGILDMGLSFTGNSEFPLGIGTGVKITRNSGFFYSASIIEGFFPTFIFGFSQKLSDVVTNKKTKSGEIKD